MHCRLRQPGVRQLSSNTSRSCRIHHLDMIWWFILTSSVHSSSLTSNFSYHRYGFIADLGYEYCPQGLEISKWEVIWRKHTLAYIVQSFLTPPLASWYIRWFSVGLSRLSVCRTILPCECQLRMRQLNIQSERFLGKKIWLFLPCAIWFRGRLGFWWRRKERHSNVGITRFDREKVS